MLMNLLLDSTAIGWALFALAVGIITGFFIPWQDIQATRIKRSALDAILVNLPAALRRVNMSNKIRSLAMLALRGDLRVRICIMKCITMVKRSIRAACHNYRASRSENLICLNFKTAARRLMRCVNNP